MAGLFQSISLTGAATEPAALPLITANPTTYTFPDLKVGQTDTVEILVHTENLPTSEWPFARMIDNGEPNGAFLRLDEPVRNDDKSIRVVFQPTTEGTLTKRMEIFCNGVTSAFVDFTGTAVGAVTTPEKQGDNWPLDPSNPLALLNETFDNVPRNQPLGLPQWKNIAEQNYRAWWGFDFTDDEVRNYTAKAVAYNSMNTSAVPYEMWLITPPLDFVNSASKWFTFKAMGDLMSDTDDARLEVYYMYLNNGEVFRSKISFDIPVGADFNGEWRDMSIDLTGSNKDVFFIGFRFSATGGSAGAASYYIDDVTYGLPNVSIPKVTDDSTETVAVFDWMGRKVDPNNWKRGVYIIRTQQNGTIENRKVMIK